MLYAIYYKLKNWFSGEWRCPTCNRFHVRCRGKLIGDELQRGFSMAFRGPAPCRCPSERGPMDIV
jgi:hypothetical protein